METMMCSRVIISGKVQGVFFRAETQRMAQRLGVRGWVRNKNDGTVEALFSGTAQKVDAAIAWCRQGSPASSVADVKIYPDEGADVPPDFSIR